MKTMKVLTVLSLLILSIQVRADFMQDIALKHFDVSGKRNSKMSKNDPQPIRQADFKSEIQWTKAVKQPDGTIDFQTSVVCSHVGKINMYDVHYSDGVLTPNLFGCTVHDGSSTIDILYGLGYAILRDVKVFSNEAAEDIKVNMGFLLTTGGLVQDSVGNGSATRDLNLKSMIGAIQPTLFSQCSSDSNGNQVCETNLDSYFTLTYEIKD